MNPLRDLSLFASGVRAERLPDRVRGHACAIAADLVGVIAAGMREPQMRALAARLAPPAERGACEVLGHSGRGTPSSAACLHGTAGTFLELDEGNRFSRGHPGIHVFPAALAAAQERRASGGRLIAATAAGYEVAARIGAACEIRPGVHPHGTWGTVGAAVAVCHLRGGDADLMQQTINIAATLGLATSVNVMRDGGLVRNAFAGVSAKMGLLANDLADSGFSGGKDTLGDVFGGIIATGFSWPRMTEALGERWEMQRNYFKLHACCRFNHAALDALAVALQGRGPVDPGEVERIDVETYSLAARLVNATPANALAAKYSLPFAVATALVHRRTDAAAFSEEAVRVSAVAALASRVRVSEASEMTLQLPALRQARVAIHLRSGKTLDGFVETNRGDAETPYTSDQLTAKFMQLAKGTWTERHAKRIHARVLRLDEVPDVTALFAEGDPI